MAEEGKLGDGALAEAVLCWNKDHESEPSAGRRAGVSQGTGVVHPSC